jgi:hypothetical protein
VATPDMYRVTANAVANSPAEASAGAYPCPHVQIVRNTAVGQCYGMTPRGIVLAAGRATRVVLTGSAFRKRLVARANRVRAARA